MLLFVSSHYKTNFLIGYNCDLIYILECNMQPPLLYKLTFRSDVRREEAVDGDFAKSSLVVIYRLTARARLRYIRISHSASL